MSSLYNKYVTKELALDSMSLPDGILLAKGGSLMVLSSGSTTGRLSVRSAGLATLGLWLARTFGCLIN